MVQIRLQVATVRNRLGGSLALPNPRSLFVSIGVHSRLNLSVHSGVQDPARQEPRPTKSARSIRVYWRPFALQS